MELNQKKRGVKRLNYRGDAFYPMANFVGLDSLEKDSLDPIYISKNEGPRSSAFEVDPKFISAFGSSIIRPNFDFAFSNSKSTGSRRWSIRLFAVPVGNSFDSSRAKSDVLFHPELSSWGLRIDYSSFLFLSEKSKSNNDPKLAYSVGVYYLGKTLADTSSRSFTVGTFQGRVGLEFVPVTEFLSVYANFNYLYFAHDVRLFIDQYNTKRLGYFYVDFGIKAFYQFQKDDSESISIFADFNFAIRNGDVRFFNPVNQDAIIPFLQIGIRKPINL